MDSLVIILVIINSILFPVVPQNGNYSYVAGGDNITQFELADNQALLAHNFLTGKYFHDIELGDTIVTITDKGVNRRYVVNNIDIYKREGNWFYSGEEIYSHIEIFEMYYTNTAYLTLQTCVAKGTDYYWGVMFVEARLIIYKKYVPI